MMAIWPLWACLTGPILPVVFTSVNLFWTDGWSAQVWQTDGDRARVCYDCRCVDCCVYDLDEDGDIDLRDVAFMLRE